MFLKYCAIFCILVHLAFSQSNSKELKEIEEILKDEELIKPYVDCILEKGECTDSDAKEIKEQIVKNLDNGCEKCSDSDKEEVKFVIKFLRTNRKDLWDELLKKYDPTGKYQEKYKSQLELK